MKLNLLPLLCLVVSSFLCSSSSAQSNPIVDSLEQKLISTIDTARVLLLIDLAYEINVNDIEKASKYVAEAKELSQQFNYDSGTGHANYASGYLYHLKEDYVLAKEKYEKALSIFERLGNDKKSGETYTRLGHIYSLRAEYGKSQEFYEKALNLAKKTGDNQNASVISFSMANNYTYLGEHSKAFQLLEECKPLIAHRPHLINYYAILGDLYNQVGNSRKSLDAFFEGIKICEEYTDTLRMAYIFKSVAETYSGMGNYENGADYYFKLIEFNKKLASPNLTIVSHLGLGELYRLWKDPGKSIGFYEKALYQAEKNQVNEVIPSCHIGMGQTHTEVGDYVLALDQFEQAKVKAEKWQLLNKQIDAQLFIGKIYIEMEEYSSALKILFETLDLTPEDWKEARVFSTLYGAIGTAFLKQGKYENSIVNFKQGLKFAEECSNTIELERYYLQLSNAYQKINNFQLALKFQNQYSILHERNLEAESSKKLLALRTQYETEEREKEILLLQKEKKMQSVAISNQQTKLTRQEVYLLTLGLLLCFGVLLFYLFFQRYDLKKKTEQLEYKNRQIELEQEHLKISQQLEMAELRSNFFTDISHEIRTPLSLIITPVEELLTESSRTPHYNSYQLIHRNAQRLLELVNQTLDFSKLESGHLPLQTERCHTGELILELTQQFFPMLQAKNQRITLINKAPFIHAQCDSDKILKALSNIISNAIEHTHSGGEIIISLENDYNTKKRNPENLLIHIKDNGKGIPAEHLQFIFDRYYQVDKKSRKGSGIGLALTRKIIKMHNGQIEVKSEENRGSVFSIQLPLFAPFAANSDKENTLWQAPSLKPMLSNKSNLPEEIEAPALLFSNEKTTKEAKAEILVIEDHADLSNYIQQRLNKEGYKVHLTPNGKEALELIEKNQPDLIISDVMMPEMDGVELLSRLKKDINTCHIPVILLTAKATLEDKMEGLKNGADDYLTKPFQIEELLVRSENLIRQRRQLQKAFSKNPFAVPPGVKVNVMDDKFLKKVLKLVEERMEDAQFNVERFCQEMGMSRTNVFNKLKALTGQNIAGFIRTIRLKKAASLIETNSGNMFEIASMTGFNTRQSFNKAFKDHFGVSPTTFKNTKKKKLIPREKKENTSASIEQS